MIRIDHTKNSGDLCTNEECKDFDYSGLEDEEASLNTVYDVSYVFIDQTDSLPSDSSPEPSFTGSRIAAHSSSRDNFLLSPNSSVCSFSSEAPRMLSRS